MNPAPDQSSPVVAVVGAGYAGLPLVEGFLEAGLCVRAYDHDEEKVRLLTRGRVPHRETPSSILTLGIEQRRFVASARPEILAEADAIIVCVPTPLKKTQEPDLTHIIEAVDEIALHRKTGSLVVLESTTYPGTTKELVVPRLTRGGACLGDDLFVAFSPERVDPGNAEYHLRNTPKVIAGMTQACLERALWFYGHVVDTLVPVSSTDTAEMVKLFENTFRAVNIGLVNEIAITSRRLGIDSREVFRAAKTKPFGFMPFYPGPGLGGHCIPVDPLYLSWKLKSLEHEAQFIALADSINRAMPSYVVQRLSDLLNHHKKPLNGSKILIYGVTYKPNIPDIRESPALSVIAELQERGAEVEYVDPFISELSELPDPLEARSVFVDFGEFDAVVVVTHHDVLPKERLCEQARLIFDTRDALSDCPDPRGVVFGL